VKYTYTQYFDILDTELLQRKEFGDRGTPNSFRYLSSDDAKRVINETIYYFAHLNNKRYNNEQTVELRDFTDYTNTTASSSVMYANWVNNVLTVPDRLFLVDAIAPYANNKWITLYDSSNLNEPFYSPDRNTVVYRGSTVFEQGETFKMFASVLPKMLKDNLTIALSAPVTVLAGGVVPIICETKQDWLSFDIGDELSLTATLAGVTTTTTQNVVAKDGMTIYITSAYTLADSISSVSVERDTDDDLIDFPYDYMRMLTLEIKKARYMRHGKRISEAEFSQLMFDTKRWTAEAGRVRRNASASAWGTSYGKR